MISLHDTNNTITNSAIAVSNNAGFITIYHLSRDLGGGSVTLRGSVAEWLACRTQARKSTGSNRSRGAVE